MAGERTARARTPGRAAVWTALLLLVGATAGAHDAAAQSSPVLDSVERAADLGEVTEARSLLDGWFASAEASDREADVGRARYLRARLTRDLDSARVDYLWVAVRGDDRYGPAARLRLAQMYVAEGRLDRAEEHLERLRADFPGSTLTFSSWLWTGNVRAAAGDRSGACGAWETAAAGQPGSASASDRDLVQSALEGCGGDAGAATPSASFSVQLGAFSSRETADELRNRVVAAGRSARVLEPSEPGGLYRVRSGRFEGREEAARHAVSLAEAGFESIVVPGAP